MDKLSIKASKLADIIKGKLYGPDHTLSGKYTFLNKAQEDDIVIRHWINDKGVEIAKDRKVSCIITQDPQDDTIKTAQKLDISLIVTDYIEYVDDLLAVNATYDELIDAIKGKVGTKVKIGLIRYKEDNSYEELELEIERKKAIDFLKKALED